MEEIVIVPIFQTQERNEPVAFDARSVSGTVVVYELRDIGKTDLIRITNIKRTNIRYRAKKG